MPAKKGTNRFERFQLLKQKGRENLISEFLVYLKTSKVKHQYVTELAAMVASHITTREGKPCNRATLLRNPRYKSMLLSYMAENLSEGTKGLKVKNIDDPKAQALVLTTQVELSNIKRDNERLRSYVAHLEARVADSSSKVERVTCATPHETKLELELAQMRFARACQSLQLVIQHLNSVVSIDVHARRIVDMTKTRGNVIVDSDIAACFFEWLESNKGIG